MPRTNYNDQSTINNEDFILSTDDTSNEEEDDDDLAAAFTHKIDNDWKPSYSIKQNPAPVRRTTRRVSGRVKIFMPNTGLQASMIVSKDNSQKTYVYKKTNVALSSSSEED
jgi:hypothetical protein